MLSNIFIVASVFVLTSALEYPCELSTNGTQCDFVVKCNEFIEPHFELTCDGTPRITLILSNAYENDLQHTFFGKLNDKVTKQVQEIRVINSTLSCVHGKAFYYFANCLRIDISHNNIKTIYTSFGSLYKLNFLNISGNNLQSFKEKLFVDSFVEKDLQVLDLSNNKISYVGRNLKQLTNLRKLYLQNNRIMKIDDIAFSGLVHLTHLFLQHNLLNTVPPSFKDLSNLKLLNMSYNNVTKLDYDILINFHKIETLDISSNHLSLVNITDFSECNELEILLMDNNSIDTLLVDEDVQYLAKIKKLSLRGNPLVCKKNGSEFETDTEKHFEIITDTATLYIDRIDRIKCESSSILITNTTETPGTTEPIPTTTSSITTLGQDKLTLPDFSLSKVNITIEDDLQATKLELDKIKMALTGFELAIESNRLQIATIMNIIDTKQPNTATTESTESASIERKSEKSSKLDSDEELDKLQNVILEQERMRSELEKIKDSISDHNIIMLGQDKSGSIDDDNVIITKLPVSDEKDGVNLVLSMATKLGIQLKHVGTVSDKQKP